MEVEWTKSSRHDVKSNMVCIFIPGNSDSSIHRYQKSNLLVQIESDRKIKFVLGLTKSTLLQFLEKSTSYNISVITFNDALTKKVPQNVTR